MDPADSEAFLQKVVRTQRLIVFGLIAGVCVFGTILTAMQFTAFHGKGLMPDPPQVAGLPILTLVAGLVTAGALVASFAMAGTMRQQIVQRLAGQPPQDPAATRATLLAGWQGGNLVRAALLEGPAILSLVLFLLTGDYALLAIAGVMLALLLANVPSEAAARRWLDTAEEELETKRAGG